MKTYKLSNKAREQRNTQLRRENFFAKHGFWPEGEAKQAVHFYKRNAAWYDAHKDLRGNGKSEFLPHTTKLMTAKNEFHEGTAKWERKEGQWRCVECSPCLNFMLKKEPADAHLELNKRGFTFQWT